MNYKPEQLGLLSNLFNCVNVHLNKRESPQNLDSSNNNNNNARFDVYILLIYTEQFEGLDVATPLKSIRSHIRKTIDGKTVHMK